MVGLGVMEYAGKHSNATHATPFDNTYNSYLNSLITLVTWLLSRDYDIRLLIGDLGDVRAKQKFKDLLRERLSAQDEERIIDEPMTSVEDVLSHIAATDIVVATRFHNVLFALICNKPVMSISFHHKCESLMSEMGLSDYCLNIDDLKAESLIEKCGDLETNANNVKQLIAEKAREFRKALDEQYKLIFGDDM